jgi:hypothetical protein
VVRELRRQARIRWGRRAIVAAVAIVALHFAVTRLFYRAPSPDVLQTYANFLAEMLLPLHSTPQQPLAAAGASVSLRDRISTNRVRYAAEIGLRLTRPLYMPSTSNGTAAYRVMQQSLHAAREKELKFKLFEDQEAPGAPEMPLLIQMVHRAGEQVIVRVPFEAERFGWRWRIEPAHLALRTASRSFEGATIERFARVPHLVFGAPGTLADMRLRTQLARAYIIAVTREIQKRADLAAIEPPAVDPAVAHLPAADPDAPAELPGGGDPGMAIPRIDPYAAAIDPDAPALDPNAPAVDDPSASP